jgi:hypothetical protein
LLVWQALPALHVSLQPPPLHTSALQSLVAPSQNWLQPPVGHSPRLQRESAQSCRHPPRQIGISQSELSWQVCRQPPPEYSSRQRVEQLDRVQSRWHEPMHRLVQVESTQVSLQDASQVSAQVLLVQVSVQP